MEIQKDARSRDDIVAGVLKSYENKRWTPRSDCVAGWLGAHLLEAEATVGWGRQLSCSANATMIPSGPRT
ncbi:hypothetical protein GCM10023317_82560 [Actinopolymorpha pittospori]|uniref:Uncharacterized protein n=1 Tax=Actinopolymorpha pittospori TaxID=648752 RepID=A0A927MVW4_9ACTN|nr:hypothetical protein [Actinopolymorpha pittospori]